MALIEVPDLSRFARLAAVELEFRVPLVGWSAERLAECLAEDVPPCLWVVEPPEPGAGRETARRLAEHTSRWVEHASRWLSALPENLSYLRLENVPVEALVMLPPGIEHLELIDVYGESNLSPEHVPNVRSVRTLVVEQWRGRLSLRGLERLRELKVRDLWIDPNELARVPGLEKLTSNDIRLGPVLQHPSLKEVDLRRAKIHDWTDVSDAVDQTTLQRLVLVEATTPEGDELEPKRSSPVVLHTPLDEFRAAVECATRIVAREYHELCGVWSSRPAPRHLPTASPIPGLAVMGSLLVDARDGLGPVQLCDTPVIEVYRGSAFPLTLAVADGCRSLSSYRWGSGVTLADQGAKLLCAWLGRD